MVKLKPEVTQSHTISVRLDLPVYEFLCDEAKKVQLSVSRAAAQVVEGWAKDQMDTPQPDYDEDDNEFEEMAERA